MTKGVDQAKKRVRELIERYRPRTVITEEPSENKRRGTSGRRLIEAVRETCKVARIKHKVISVAQVTRAFAAADARTKYQRATIVAEYFPELKPHLPKPRKPWKSEAEVMAVFDAAVLSLGMTTKEFSLEDS